MIAAIPARFDDCGRVMPAKEKRGARRALCAAAFGVMAGCATSASAEPPGPPPPEQRKADGATELRGVEDTIRASEDQRRSIQSEIESIRTDKARLMDALIATTARVQESERGVAAADERVIGLNEKAVALDRSLQARRGAIVEILAAIQRMGANPPPAILVRSGDPLQLREAVKQAAVWTYDSHGNRVESRADLPVGWYVLGDPSGK